MTIELNGTAVLKDGKQIGSLEGERCVLYSRPAPQVYAAIKRVAGNDALKFDILPENQPAAQVSAPNGGPGEPVTGAGLSPHETRSETQAEGGLPTLSPPPPASLSITYDGADPWKSRVTITLGGEVIATGEREWIDLARAIPEDVEDEIAGRLAEKLGIRAKKIEFRPPPQPQPAASLASAKSVPGSYVKDGITYIPVASRGEEGWVNDKMLKVFQE